MAPGFAFRRAFSRRLRLICLALALTPAPAFAQVPSADAGAIVLDRLGRDLDARLAAAVALGATANAADAAPAAIASLGRALLDWENEEELRREAARQLARFTAHAELASTPLIQALYQELARGASPSNVYVAADAARALGALGERRSFMPLFRLMNSRFPTFARRQAQLALNQLDFSRESRESPANAPR